MKVGEEFKCELFSGKTFRVVECFSNGMASLELEDSGVRYLAKGDDFNEPHLCLAHQLKEKITLTKIERSFKW